MTAGTIDSLAAGWDAHLELGYARHGRATVPTLRRHHGPLRVLRHTRLESGSCEHVLVHPPGGVAGGDRLRFDVELGSGADVLLTSVGAAKWYNGFGRRATQVVQARIGPGARLAWLPLENILYSGADVQLGANFALSGDASLFYGDIVCLGRPACAERYATGRWCQRTEIERDGRLLWCEHVVLHAVGALAHSPAALDGHTVVGTVVWAGAALPTALHAAVRALTVEGTAAAAQLPDVWLARYLGDSAEGAQHWLRAVRTLLHPHTHGGEAHSPRIWAT